MLTMDQCAVTLCFAIGGTSTTPDVKIPGTGGGSGGGIYNLAIATIDRSTISDCVATGGIGRDGSSGGDNGGGGGGAGAGAGISCEGGGFLTIKSSTISGNTATGGNGGGARIALMTSGGGAGGGSIDANGGLSGVGGVGADVDMVGGDGSVTGGGGGGASGTAFAGGNGGFGCGGGGGGVGANGGTAGDNAATGAGNGGNGVTGSGGGGGGSGLGGGVYAASTIVITDCTIASNTAAGGLGGTPSGGGVAGTDGEGRGGGIYVRSGATVTLENTIVADNAGVLGSPDILGTVVTNDFNIIEDITGTVLSPGAQGNDVTGMDPMLAALQDAGGPTWTHPLTAASAIAIDAGGGTTPATDQRGFLRNVGTKDIGSFEYNTNNAPPVLSTPGTPGSDFVAGSDFILVAHPGDVFGTDVNVLLNVTDADTDNIDVTVTFVSDPMGGAVELPGITRPPDPSMAAPFAITWTGTVDPVTVMTGNYTYTVVLTDNITLPVTYTVIIAIGNAAPDLTLASPTGFLAGSDFDLTVNSGASVAALNADLDVTDVDLDMITMTVVFLNGPNGATAPVGVVPPVDATMAAPFTISWLGTMDQANPPGTYTYTVTITDSVIATPLSFNIRMTMNNALPTHVAGPDATSGNGTTAGNAYTSETLTGETTSFTLAAVSDTNTSQTLTIDMSTAQVGNPTGGSGFDMTLVNNTIVATPTAALVFPDDIGIHTFQVRIADGIGQLDVYISIVVSQGPLANIIVTESSLTGLSVFNGDPAPLTQGVSARNLGSTIVGTTSESVVEIFITNNGTGTMTLNAPTLMDAGSPNFFLDLSGILLSLPPGVTTSFKIGFKPFVFPAGLGGKTATASITHSGSNTTTPFTFGVAGEGIGATGGGEGGGSSTFPSCALHRDGPNNPLVVIIAGLFLLLLTRTCRKRHLRQVH